jgi:multidrug resistance protein
MKRSPLLILFITVVIDLLGFGIILPLLPLYIDKFGGTPVVAGWLSTVFSVMQFIFAPIWGRASDVWGRRPLILLSLAGSALSFFIFGLAHSLWMLFLARTAAGALTAASLPAAQAYIADVTPPEKRSRGMALIGMAFGIGFAGGPMIGGWLGHRYGLSAPAFAVAGLAAANFVWSFFALPEPREHAEGATETRSVQALRPARVMAAFANPAIGRLMTVFGLSTFSFAMMEATFTWLILFRFVEPSLGAGVSHAVLEQEAARAAGHVFMVVGLTAIVAQGAVMSGLAQRAGEARVVAVGALILTGALLGIAGAATMATLTVLAAALSVGSAMVQPVLLSLVSKRAPEGERGGVLGVQQGLGSLARMVAPPAGTYLLQRFSPATPYYLAACLMGLAVIAALTLGRPAPDPA